MLIHATLKKGLAEVWMVQPDGRFPSNVAESGQRFAQAVVAWFVTANSLTFMCQTATARQSQLGSQAADALSRGAPQAAGYALGQAVADYVDGQSFGPGTAQKPIAAVAGGLMIAAVFSDMKLTISQRAKKIADACTLIAHSSLVLFPFLPPATCPVL